MLLDSQDALIKAFEEKFKDARFHPAKVNRVTRQPVFIEALKHMGHLVQSYVVYDKREGHCLSDQNGYLKTFDFAIEAICLSRYMEAHVKDLVQDEEEKEAENQEAEELKEADQETEHDIETIRPYRKTFKEDKKMDITDIRLNLTKKEGPVKAIGSFSLDNAFAVRCVRVVENGKGGLFVAFPSRKKADGKFEDLAFPSTSEFYKEITEKILDEYQNVVLQKNQEKKEGQEATYAEDYEAEENESMVAENEEKQAEKPAEAETAAPKRKAKGR